VELAARPCYWLLRQRERGRVAGMDLSGGREAAMPPFLPVDVSASTLGTYLPAGRLRSLRSVAFLQWMPPASPPAHLPLSDAVTSIPLLLRRFTPVDATFIHFGPSSTVGRRNLHPRRQTSAVCEKVTGSGAGSGSRI
jgi:hypothetical protein